MLGMAVPVSSSKKSRSNGHRGRRRSDGSSTSNYQGSSCESDDGGGGRAGIGRKKRLRNDNGRILKQRRPKESSVYRYVSHLCLSKPGDKPTHLQTLTVAGGSGLIGS